MSNTPKPGTLYAGRHILSHSGIYIDVFDPKPAMFTLEDIAEGIAYCYRWRGHTRSGSKIVVAEHSIRVACHADNDADFIAGGFHDASEGFLGDLASPIKKEMAFYKEVEDRVMRVIAAKFNFQWPLPAAVKEYDRLELHREWEDCVMSNNSPALSPEVAKAKWIETFKPLCS